MNKTNIKNFSTEFLILILKIIFGVIIIVGGVSVVLNSEGVVVLVALISGFLIVIPIEIIIIFGTVLIIIGIAFIALSTIISLKNLKKHKKEEIRYEEKQEYMNPSHSALGASYSTRMDRYLRFFHAHQKFQ